MALLFHFTIHRKVAASDKIGTPWLQITGFLSLFSLVWRRALRSRHRFRLTVHFVFAQCPYIRGFVIQERCDVCQT